MTTKRIALAAVLLADALAMGAGVARAQETITTASVFVPGSIFVGTLQPDQSDNTIFRIATDGDISVFADGILGGVRSLAFNTQARALYALITIESGSDGLPPAESKILRFDSLGQSSVFADLSPSFPTAGETDLEIRSDGSVFITGSSNKVFEITKDGNVLERFDAGTEAVIHALEFAENGELYLGNRGGEILRVDPGFGSSELFATVPVSHFQTDFQGLEFNAAGDLIAAVQDFSQPNNLFSITPSGSVTGLTGVADQIGTIATGIGDQILVTANPSSGNVEVFSSGGVPITTYSLGRQLSGIEVVPQVLPEAILLDVKPGSDTDPINLKSKGVLPVAVVSTDLFNAADVDVATLLFGDPVLIDAGVIGVSPIGSSLEDVTGDGLLDLLLKFSIPEMVETGVIGSLTGTLRLTGSTLSGKLLVGVDNVSIRPIPEPATWLLALLAWAMVPRRGCHCSCLP